MKGAIVAMLAFICAVLIFKHARVTPRTRLCANADGAITLLARNQGITDLSTESAG
ncbi:hypothetical protein BN961_02085 [Afipia felis]|uniref:Uncharacterized protein n=1 Tax=Afipia felis TaxID=1035 RepID=A0A090MQZ7_AFIFE|nr:hypothetical protein BN961_02085 [Afipia felis]